MSEPLEIRCSFCRSRPLLAVCDKDLASGEWFVHVKSWKGGRLYTEIVVTEGVVRIRCRDCKRWLKLHIKRAAVETTPERLPNSISV